MSARQRLWLRGVAAQFLGGGRRPGHASQDQGKKTRRAPDPVHPAEERCVRACTTARWKGTSYLGASGHGDEKDDPNRRCAQGQLEGFPSWKAEQSELGGVDPDEQGLEKRSKGLRTERVKRRRRSSITIGAYRERSLTSPRSMKEVRSCGRAVSVALESRRFTRRGVTYRLNEVCTVLV